MSLVRKVIIFVGLSWREQCLFLQVICLTGIVRLLILLLPFRWLAPALSRHLKQSPIKEDDNKLAVTRQIGRVIETVSRHTPWESKCLIQAITGKILLRHYCLSNTLYLGVVKDKNKKMVAHAWLHSGDVVVTGGFSTQKYTIVSQFADNFEERS